MAFNFKVAENKQPWWTKQERILSWDEIGERIRAILAANREAEASKSRGYYVSRNVLEQLSGLWPNQFAILRFQTFYGWTMENFQQWEKQEKAGKYYFRYRVILSRVLLDYEKGEVDVWKENGAAHPKIVRRAHGKEVPHPHEAPMTMEFNGMSFTVGSKLNGAK